MTALLGMLKPPTPESLLRQALPREVRGLVGKSLGAGTASAPGAEKRSRPRISTDELNARGVAAIQEKWPDLPSRIKGLKDSAPDPRGALEKAFDWLDLPRNLVGNAIGALAGVDLSNLPTGAMGLPRVYMSDVLEKLGIRDRIAKAVVGFAGDILIDPMTYLVPSGKIGLSLSKGVPSMLKGGRAMMRQAAEAMVRGEAAAIPEQVLKALGMTAERAVTAGASAARQRGADAASYLFGKQGGFLGKLLVNRAMGVHGPDAAAAAREFIASVGQKGSTIARIPFTEAGITLPFGKRAALARQFAAGKAGVAADATIQAIGKVQQGQRAAFQEVKAGRQTAKQASETAAAIQGRLDEAQAHYDRVVQAWKDANATGAALGRHWQRTMLRTPAVRKAQRDLQLVKDTLARAQAQALLGNPPVPGVRQTLTQAAGTKGPAAEALRAAAKAAPRQTTYAPEVAQVRTPLQLAKAEAARIPGLQEQAKAGVARATVGQEAMLAGTEAARMAPFADDASLPFKLAAEQKFGPTYLPDSVVQSRAAARVAAAKTSTERAFAEVQGVYDRAVNAVGRTKQALFGHGPSELGRELAGARTRMGKGSSVIGQRAATAIHAKADPAVQAIAARTGMSADDARAALMEFVISGGPAKAAARFAADDPIHAFLAGPAGLARGLSPEVQRFIREVRPELDKLREELVKRGAKIGEIEDYLAYVLTPEARAAAADQAERVVRNYQPSRARQVRFVLREGEALPAELAKVVPQSHFLPGGREFVVLDTDEKALALARSLAKGEDAPLKLVGDYAISPLQWNKWRAEGTVGQAAFGGDFRGPQVAEDVAGSVGATYRKAGYTHGAFDLRDAIRHFAASFPDGAVAREKNLAGWTTVADVFADHQNSPLFHLFGKSMAAQGLALPTPVAKQLQAFVALSDTPREIRGIRAVLDWYVNRVWKPLTLLSPSYFIRNTAQAFIGAAMGGADVSAVAAKSLPNSPIFKAVAAAQKGQSLAGMSVRVLGRDMPAEQFIELLRRQNLMGTGLAATILQPGMWEKTKAAYRALGSRWFEFVQRQEDVVRASIFHSFLEEGMDIRQAALKTVLAMPDLSDMTKFDNAVRQWVPFYSWMRKNSAAILRLTAGAPYLPSLPEKARRAIEMALVGDGVDRRLRPEWQNEMQAVQIAGDQRRGVVFLLANWLPFQDVMDAFAGAQTPGHMFNALLSKLRPDLKFIIEQGTGVDIFRRRQQEQYGTADLLRAVPSAVAGRSGTPLDNVLGLRPIREVGRVLDMPTPGYAVGRAFAAGAFQPVDAERGLAAVDYQTQQQLQALRSKINRALQVNDPTEAGALARQYMALSRRRQELGLRVPRKVAASLQAAGVTQ